MHCASDTAIEHVLLSTVSSQGIKSCTFTFWWSLIATVWYKTKKEQWTQRCPSFSPWLCTVLLSMKQTLGQHSLLHSTPLYQQLMTLVLLLVLHACSLNHIQWCWNMCSPRWCGFGEERFWLLACYLFQAVGGAQLLNLWESLLKKGASLTNTTSWRIMMNAIHPPCLAHM